MSWLRNKYKGLSSKERKQVWILVIFSFLAGYAFYAAHTWEQMFHTEKMANRKADRIEKRIGEISAPELEDGISDGTLKQLLDETSDQEVVLRGFASPLLPDGDSEAREELKLKLTQLANSNQLRLENLKSHQFGNTKPLSELQGNELREFFNERPSFQLYLTGHYFNLIQFIDALSGLKYQVYVDDLDLELLNSESSLLKINMVLKL